MFTVLVVHSQKRKNWKVYETGNTYFIYKNELDKACFQHDMDYGEIKYLAKETQ